MVPTASDTTHVLPTTRLTHSNLHPFRLIGRNTAADREQDACRSICAAGTTTSLSDGQRLRYSTSRSRWDPFVHGRQRRNAVAAQSHDVLVNLRLTSYRQTNSPLYSSPATPRAESRSPQSLLVGIKMVNPNACQSSHTQHDRGHATWAVPLTKK